MITDDMRAALKLTSLNSTPQPILGVDFTSSPTRRKPITCAWGRLEGNAFVLDELIACPDMAAFAEVLNRPAWLGGFDLPFGLPRELVEHLGWPNDWLGYIQYYAALSRADIRATFKAFCDARAVGNKFAHRATDRPAASSPSMKWVNPPVAYMLHAGVPALLASGCSLAGLHTADTKRVALEAYPAFAARAVIGKASYKSDDVAKQTPVRAQARAALIMGVSEHSHPDLGLRLKASSTQLVQLQADASGDTLDAVLCAMQAAWASQQANYGLPPMMDPLEGWIVSVPFS